MSCPVGSASLRDVVCVRYVETVTVAVASVECGSTYVTQEGDEVLHTNVRHKSEATAAAIAVKAMMQQERCFRNTRAATMLRM